MPKIVINISSAEEIEQGIKLIKEYKTSLQSKITSLVRQMCLEGEDYAINALGHVDTGETLSSIHGELMGGYRNGQRGVIIAGGAAVWIEFGTGVHYNGAAGSSPHPLGTTVQPPHLIGTYGAGHGADPDGWLYRDESGEWHKTKGIPANMFFYETVKQLERRYPDLAREVFGAS